MAAISRDLLEFRSHGLDGRACLLVIDDVWENHHLTPFLWIKCARMVTTRRFNLLTSANVFRVGEMSASEASSVLQRQTTTRFDTQALAQLSARLGNWPLLLNLTAGALANRVAVGNDAAGALAYVSRAVDKRGPEAFDPANTHARDAAVSTTIAASLDPLDKEDCQRFADLAVFAGHGDVPVSLLERIWNEFV